MKRATAADFPELQRVFAGYLHEDFPEQHGTPAAALRAFHEDAGRAERQRFAREAKRFVAHTATLDFSDVRELLAQLGCRWTPPSREAIAELLTGYTPERL
jgi:hypothetical protein